MSLLLIHADSVATLAADDPIVPAADLKRIEDSLALLREAGKVKDASETRAAAAADEAKAAGHAQGVASGRAEAKSDGDAALFQLTVKAAAERRRQRSDVSALALEVVRRIANDLGADQTIAALADKATADLLPDAIATVRVPPASLAAVTARLAARSALKVEADPDLGPYDCVVETPLGTTRAGLETQLASIARAWDDAKPRERRDES